MTPRPGKVEVPIAGEVISRRPKGAASRAHYKATHKDEGEDVSRDLQKIVRLDGPAKINWLCKARKIPPVVRLATFPSNLRVTMGCGASAPVASVGRPLYFSGPRYDEKRPQARRNPESYRTRIVTMLTTDEGDFEVQVSSKSEPEPESLEKKKVTFAFVSEADDEVEFMQELPKKRVTFSVVVDTHFFRDEDAPPARPVQVSVAWGDSGCMAPMPPRKVLPRVPNQPETEEMQDMHPFSHGLRELPVLCTECTEA
ncbi:unnamed protein product [Symbiodinium sp. CCMP2592]|nr:unnamed protein product [Symbiodinium sp. CCMP2592]